jgi:hypothetical protein
MRTQGEARFRRMVIPLAIAAVLVGIPIALWAINTYYMPLDMVIERGISKLGLSEVVAQTRNGLGQ